VTLVAAFGLVTACGDDGPATPAISGENPGEVTIPTLPPTTTSTPLEPADAGAPDASAPTTTASDGDAGGS
jgi:hypothetical protein